MSGMIGEDVIMPASNLNLCNLQWQDRSYCPRIHYLACEV